jgi:hypothetical protein
VNDHGPAGQESEGFSGKSDGGVARGNYGDDRHAIISGDSILAFALRQETPPRAPSFWFRPAPAALFGIAAAVLVSVSALTLSRHLRDQAESTMGRAEWIWYARAGRKPAPIRFYATRDVELPAVARRATAKLFVDREYVLYVNGRRAGGGSRRPGDPLAVYEVASFLRPGLNRVAIEASSPDGVGGILFSLEGDGIEPGAFASDTRWRVDLDASAVANGARYRPIVWGRPPQYPWGYPRLPEAGS